MAFAIYRSTLLQGVGAWDTAEAQTVPPLLGTMHPTGFPAYTLLGWVASAVLTPLGHPAFRMNLLSAILAAIAAGATVSILRRLAVPLAIAVAGALGFALTPITWEISAAADVHALHLALAALITLALVRWASLVDASAADPSDHRAAARADRAILVAAVLFGVAVANHGLTILFIPGVVLYVLAVDRGVLRRPRLVVGALAASIGTALLLYLELPIRSGLIPGPLLYGHPDTLAGFIEVITARQFQGTFAPILEDPAGALQRVVTIWESQMGLAVAFVLPAFLVTAFRNPRYALLTGITTLITCLFAASYFNAVISRYYLVPVLFGWTWIAIMAATIVERIADRAGLDPAAAADPGLDPAADAGPPGGSLRPLTAVAVLLAGAMLLPTALDLPYRWRVEDRSRETMMADWLAGAMTATEPDAVIVSWWSYSTTLWYGQLIEGLRPDIWVVDDRTLIDDNLGSVDDVIAANLGTRPVYVIRAQASDLQDLETRFVIEPVDQVSELYRVTGPVETSQP